MLARRITRRTSMPRNRDNAVILLNHEKTTRILLKTYQKAGLKRNADLDPTQKEEGRDRVVTLSERHHLLPHGIAPLRSSLTTASPSSRPSHSLTELLWNRLAILDRRPWIVINIKQCLSLLRTPIDLSNKDWASRKKHLRQIFSKKSTNSLERLKTQEERIAYHRTRRNRLPPLRRKGSSPKRTASGCSGKPESPPPAPSWECAGGRSTSGS